MEILYADCFSGASGDMLLGALIELGTDSQWLQSEISLLGIGPFSLEVKKVQKGALQCTHCMVKVEGAQRGVSGLKDIIGIIENSKLQGEIQEQGIHLFQALGEVEAHIHGIPATEVHFHELGAMDTLIDVFGVLISIKHLGIEAVYASPLPLGSGIIDTMHGPIPIPAPATLALLEGVPVVYTGLQAELVTPTGALLIKHLAKGFGPPPAMTLKKIGYGAGTRDLPDRPNCLRLILGVSDERLDEDHIHMLECDIDDMNPEFYPYLFERLFDAEALDVNITQIMMKKGRPGIKVTVMGKTGSAQVLAHCLLTETSTIGVRVQDVRRFKAFREIKEIRTRYGPVRVKFAWMGKQLINIAPEYEDISKIARVYNRPLKLLYQEIIEEAEKQTGYPIDKKKI